MRKLAWDAHFRRSFKRRTRRDPLLQERVLDALSRLSQDPFDPALKTHRLSGRLKGMWACWVEYDCCIIFAFEPDPDAEQELIVLIDLGTHEEVY